jgi:hypothetical protein
VDRFQADPDRVFRHIYNVPPALLADDATHDELRLVA